MRRLSQLLGASGLAMSPGMPVAAQTSPVQFPVSAAPAGTEATNQTNSKPSAEMPATSEGIIITASRRSESIREVPTAVSAFDGAKLRDQQIVSLNDLSALTPNVQISTYLTNADINIRGVGNGNFVNAGGDPGVAVHANGVYLGQAALALSTFLDVERVEVLRGPQGTLFGRNATGGAVNIIPNAPTTEFSYGADVSAGVDPTLVRSSGYFSGPLDGAARLLGRVSIEQNYNSGYTRNRAPNGPSRLDGNDDFAVRGQLEWRATDDLNIRALAEYQQNKDAGPAAYLLGTPDAGALVFPDPLNPIVLPADFPTGNPRTRTAYASVGRRDMHATRVDLTTDWSLGGGNLKFLASYNENRNFIAQDGDGTAIPFTASFFTNKAHQVYLEAIYTSDASQPFTYVIGANFFDENLQQRVLIPTSGYTTILPVYTAGGTVDTRSYGIFAHLDYRLLPSTKIFGGLRYSHDRKRATEFFNLRPVFAPGLPTNNADRRAWSNVSYEAGISHDFSRLVTGYAKYATGYKSGGYSISSFNPPFDPETNSNIELGLKGSVLDGAVRANIAAFHMKYKDLQVTQVQGLISAVTNAARATIDGVEVETVLRPVSYLRIEANGALLKAKFDRFTTLDSARPVLGPLDLTGNTLSNAPRWSGSIGAYGIIPAGGGTINPGVRFDWRGRIFFNEFNIPISSQNAVGKLNLFLDYRTADSRWTAGVFALNVTDRASKANVVVVSALLGSLAVGQYQPGRQVGVKLGYHF